MDSELDKSNEVNEIKESKIELNKKDFKTMCIAFLLTILLISIFNSIVMGIYFYNAYNYKYSVTTSNQNNNGNENLNTTTNGGEK